MGIYTNFYSQNCNDVSLTKLSNPVVKSGFAVISRLSISVIAEAVALFKDGI